MARSAADATDFAELDNEVQEMPKPIRGGQLGRTQAVDQLVNVIADEQPHRILNVTRETQPRWSRKLRYAARLAEKDVEIVYVPEDRETEQPPGLYFKGYQKGTAPKRGLRK